NQTTTQYTYDGLGHRVTKTVGGQTTTYVYDPFGNLAQEYGPASPVMAPEYLVADALGSTRLVTDSSGAALRCYDYLPFGEELAAGTGGRTAPCFGNATYPASGPDVVNQKFTGKERDQETGLDWFASRYFSGAQGRFTSPDRPLLGQDRGNPQSWNLYAYGLNNPLRFADPTGHFAEEADCETRPNDCKPQIKPLPQTTNLGQTTDRIVGGFKGLLTAGLNLLELLPGNHSTIEDLKSKVEPSSENQKFGAEVGGMLGMLLPGGQAEEAGGLIEAASSARAGLNLRKALASDQQVGEILAGAGEIIAGPGARK